MQIDSAPTNVTDQRAGAVEELRLALSMRGGVSLAVWIGGAVAEIEALRTAVDRQATAGRKDDTSGHASVYRRLAHLARYETVTVDVLSGASAGGLNGAIYAASLVYGFDFSEMADLWLTLADIEALSRPTPWRPGEGRRPSLLEGDAYFLTQLEQRLAELMAPAGMGPAATGADQRLDLFLSATRKDPVERVLRNDPFADIQETRSAAFFHFRHLGSVGSPLSDFPAGDVELAARRLALAGRASSSFPVAFEPARVWSGPGAEDGVLNMLGMFSEISDQPIRVIDGGVLDNIPVARAIQAIAAAPASGPASRWLLYLHPSPPEPDGVDEAEPPGQADQSLTGVLSDLGTTIRLKFDGESLVEDMLTLDAHNREVAERLATREALLDDAALAADVARLPATRSWAGIDARRVRTVLIDPDLAMATHPFVRRGFGSVLESWGAGVRSTFFELLPDVLAAAYEEGDVRGSAPLLALGDSIEVLLRLSQQISGPDAAGAEAALYRVRLLVEVLHSIWEQHWAEAATQPPAAGADADAIRRWTAQVADGALVASERVSAEVIETIGAPNPIAFHASLASLFDRVPTTPGEIVLDEIWQMVAVHARVLLEAADNQGLDDSLVVFLDGRPDLAEGLMAAARASAPLHRRVMSGESIIRFLRVSGASRSPLEVWFTGGPPLSVTDKLAGNQFVNFGAFFSAQWRANDWMWGRLDAAKSLVDLLADSTRWFGSGGTVESVVRAVGEAVTAPFDPSVTDATEWNAWIQSRWSEARPAAVAEIEGAAASPGVPAELTEVKRLLVTRLHAEHLARELPWVAATPKGATTTVDRGGSLGPTETQDLADRLTAGTDTIPGDLEPRRWARIGVRLGLNAWRALRPERLPARVGTSLVKPLYLFVLGVVVFPRRALLAGVVGFAALTLGRWEAESEWWWSGPWRETGAVGYGSWARRAAFLTTMALVALLVWLEARSYARRRDPGALLALVVGLALGAFVVIEYAVAGASYSPLIVPLAAAVVVFLGMWWMSPPALVGCFVVALAPYVALWFLGPRSDWFSSGWWALASFALALGTTTAYVTLVDVFPPRRPVDRHQHQRPEPV